MTTGTTRRQRNSSEDLDLSITADLGKAYVPFLRRHVKSAHAELNPPLRELSLALVGDKRMSELHMQFMQIPGPADVLTFPLEQDRKGRVLAGEVVVCVPEARRRAREEGVPVRKELLLYALHGLLHLCGFDDRTDSDFAAMHRAEDSILTAIGIGPVFSPSKSNHSSRTRPRRSGGHARRLNVRMNRDSVRSSRESME